MYNGTNLHHVMPGQLQQHQRHVVPLSFYNQVARRLASAGRSDSIERMAEAGIEPSVGSRGDSYDNALAESINGLCKAELIHLRVSWKSRESVELATLHWVHWFNRIRLLEPIGYIPPAEAEATSGSNSPTRSL
jgi:putative transposase